MFVKYAVAYYVFACFREGVGVEKRKAGFTVHYRYSRQVQT